MNKRINLKIGSDRLCMTEAKVGPMGLQCDKLQRDDQGHYWQPLQERCRGHSKTGNVPTPNLIEEERAQQTDNMTKKTYQEECDTSLCLCSSDICI